MVRLVNLTVEFAQPQLPKATETIANKPRNIVISNQIKASSPQTEEPEEPPLTEAEFLTQNPPTCDPGVSHSIWTQLALDKAAADVLPTQTTAQLTVLSQLTQSAEEASSDVSIELASLKRQAEEKNATDELKRRHEEMRLKRLTLLAAQRDAED